MTEAEMFRWLVDNRATLFWTPPMKWTREDGSEFYCNFVLSSHNTQWGAYPTVEEAILNAVESLKERNEKD